LILSRQEQVIYDWLFEIADVDRDGLVTSAEGAAFLSRSGLDRPTLQTIWSMADPVGRGYLCRPAFAVACRGVSYAQHILYKTLKEGSQTPSTPPPVLATEDFQAKLREKMALFRISPPDLPMFTGLSVTEPGAADSDILMDSAVGSGSNALWGRTSASGWRAYIPHVSNLQLIAALFFLLVLSVVIIQVQLPAGESVLGHLLTHLQPNVVGSSPTAIAAACLRYQSPQTMFKWYGSPVSASAIAIAANQHWMLAEADGVEDSFNEADSPGDSRGDGSYHPSSFRSTIDLYWGTRNNAPLFHPEALRMMALPHVHRVWEERDIFFHRLHNLPTTKSVGPHAWVLPWQLGQLKQWIRTQMREDDPRDLLLFLRGSKDARHFLRGPAAIDAFLLQWSHHSASGNEGEPILQATDTGTMGLSRVASPEDEDASSALGETTSFDGNVIVEEYLERPLLLVPEKRKQTLRVYVLVLSFAPLRVYLHPAGEVMTCVESLDETLATTAGHFCRDRRAGLEVITLQAWWKQVAAMRGGNGQDDDDVLETDSIPGWSKQLWWDIHEAVGLALASGALAQQDYISRQAGGEGTTPGSMQLFAVSLMVDEDYRPWILAVDPHPKRLYAKEIEGVGAQNGAHIVRRGVMQDTFALLHALQHWRQGSHPQLEAMLQSAAASGGGDDNQSGEASRAVRESMALSLLLPQRPSQWQPVSLCHRQRSEETADCQAVLERNNGAWQQHLPGNWEEQVAWQVWAASISEEHVLPLL
jgi:hypothetical protein